MSSIRRWKDYSTVVLFVIMSAFVPMGSEATAVPLPAGSYAITSGDLTGGTFTIGPPGDFTAWDLSFPASSAPPATFTPTFNVTNPTPAPTFNQIDAGKNNLQFQTGTLFSGIVYNFTAETSTTIGQRYQYSIFDKFDLVLARSGEGNVGEIPEPTTILLLSSGLLGLAGYRWHQRRREGPQLG